MSNVKIIFFSFLFLLATSNAFASPFQLGDSYEHCLFEVELAHQKNLVKILENQLFVYNDCVLEGYSKSYCGDKAQTFFQEEEKKAIDLRGKKLYSCACLYQ